MSLKVIEPNKVIQDAIYIEDFEFNCGRKALSALDDMFKQAEAVPEMTLEEINAEIADARSARKAAR